MTELVALALPPSEVPEAVRRIWDRGDAVAILPLGGPRSWRDELLRTLRPDAVLGRDGEEVRHGGGDTGGPSLCDGDALVMATSGTSGDPKGVVLTHHSLDHAAFASSVYLGLDAEPCWLGCLPLDHIGGFGVMSRALRCNLDLVVHDRFDAPAVERAALDGCTHTSLVPTTLARIDPTLFRRILLGGSAIPANRPANCVATYGMTESAGGVVYDGLGLNGVDLRIDRAGEILLRGPTMLRCYRDGTTPLDDAGWYATGDLGEIDGDTGVLTVLGRADDVINTGGEKVWPERVEALLRRHRSVSEVGVAGSEDPEWGQVVVAHVVAADPDAPPTLQALRDLVVAELPAHCAPRRLVLTDRLPRTSIGKLKRSELGRPQRHPQRPRS